MGAFGQYSDDIQDIERFWAEEKATLAKHPEMEQLIRDRKYHEVILWYVHHISQTKQRELRKSLTLPLLPEHDLENESSGVFPPGGGLGCDSAHAKQTTAKNTEYVQWPEEVVYTATGHGAFPFWDNGGPGCSHCDPSVSNSAQIKTLYSGDHYSGPIKMFTWSSGQALDFWYYTKPDGTPVQQGEGCQQPGGKKPTACASMLPIVLYHDWSTFANASFAASDFEIPSVCRLHPYLAPFLEILHRL